MGRQPCCDKFELRRGPWSMEEDHKLMTFILNNGIQCWRMVPKLAGLQRCGKSCRLRWINYLRPDLKRGALSESEENQIIQLHARLGNRWSRIASYIPGRTDNEIKNHWNTRIRKKLKRLGIDPVTHEPIAQQAADKVEDEKTDAVSSPKGEDITTFDVKLSSMHSDFPNEGANSIMNCKNHAGMASHEYQTLCGRLDVDLSMVTCGAINYPCTTSSCSPSFSVQDSFRLASNGDANCAHHHEDSVQQHGVDSMDSSLAEWNYFNQLDERFFFSEHY